MMDWIQIKESTQAFDRIERLDHGDNLHKSPTFSISLSVTVRCYRTRFTATALDSSKWIGLNQGPRRSLLVDTGRCPPPYFPPAKSNYFPNEQRTHKTSDFN